MAILVLKGGPVQKNSWQGLVNPSLLAAILGLIINWMHVTIPEIILTPLRIMDNATVPLAMLIMGYLLSDLKANLKMFNWELALVYFCKLFLYPLLAYLLMLPLKLNPLVRTVVLMQAAMPSMASTPVLVEKYGGDGEFAVTAVFFTTLLSMIMIPLIL